MKTDELNLNHLIADNGKVLRRIADGWIAGKEIFLGLTYYLNGVLLEQPLQELPEHYEEIDAPAEDSAVDDEPEVDVELLGDPQLEETPSEGSPPDEQALKRQIIERIRLRYSISDELAIIRQRDTKPEEFAEYFAYCEECKNSVKQE